MTNEQLANKIIKIMQDAGLSHEDMIKVIKLVQEKFKQLKI